MGVCINMGLYHYGLCVLVWVSNPECVSLWVMCIGMGIQPRVYYYGYVYWYGYPTPSVYYYGIVSVEI